MLRPCHSTPYRVRFRVETVGETTELRARVWTRGATEPTTWTVTATDSAAALQDTAGGYAFDLYNSVSSSSVFIDDVRIQAWPQP